MRLDNTQEMPSQPHWSYLRQHLRLDPDVHAEEAGRLLVPLAEQLLSLGEPVVADETLKRVPPGGIGDDSLGPVGKLGVPNGDRNRVVALSRTLTANASHQFHTGNSFHTQYHT